MADAEPILLIGAGGHAEACIDVIEQQGRFRVVGLVGQRAEVGGTVLGYTVVGEDDELPTLTRLARSVLIAVGQIRTADARVRLHARVVELGYEPAGVVSPRAYVSRHAAVGAGTIVMHDAVINAGARVGSNCIINTRCLIEHGAEIGDHCHVATSATINSGVRVGHRTFIGSGCTVRQGITIGEACVIGMGQVMRRSCPDGSWLPRPEGEK
jgi:sugar O-acyltransferase (sialic acid O-acetyltransferase NeuD family)